MPEKGHYISREGGVNVPLRSSWRSRWDSHGALLLLTLPNKPPSMTRIQPGMPQGLLSPADGIANLSLQVTTSARKTAGSSEFLTETDISIILYYSKL
jgi:hypothetical protein